MGFLRWRAMHPCEILGRCFACAVLLALLSPDCRAQTALTPAQALNYRRVAELQFAPDGSRLAFVVYSYQWDWKPHLWMLEIAGGSARELTPTKVSERSPQWSPEGKMLAFLSNRGGKVQVYVLPVPSGEATPVTARKYGVTSFHWSPDGRSIAYLAKDDDAPVADNGPQVADRETDLARLWVFDIASKTTHRLGPT